AVEAVQQEVAEAVERLRVQPHELVDWWVEVLMQDRRAVVGRERRQLGSRERTLAAEPLPQPRADRHAAGLARQLGQVRVPAGPEVDGVEGDGELERERVGRCR